ncbi:MAG: hypothetical protein GQ565_07510 [Candidatus Aegiribacteria sp.]|nr:hypothetical protein [Candidatus Aegiribacteria sp.]
MYEKRLSELEEWVWSVWNNRDITPVEFQKIEEELENIYKGTNDHKCLWILSEMYTVKSIWAKKKITELSRKGFEQESTHGGFHDSFSTSQGGALADFKKRNHYKLIKYYKSYNHENPTYYYSRRILIMNLIENYRFEEAVQEIKEAYKVAGDRAYLLDFLKGDVLYQSGKHNEAIKLWEDTVEANKNNYYCYFKYADQLATYGKYDEALRIYRKSFDMQKRPRRIDSLETMVQLYEIKGNKEMMLNTLNEIIDVYRDDYSIIDGEAGEFYRHRDEILAELKV